MCYGEIQPENSEQIGTLNVTVNKQARRGESRLHGVPRVSP